MATLPLVYILLLNYHGTDHTFACLDSLKNLDYPHYKIVVIDNASTDDSVPRIQARLETCPSEFEFLQSSHNKGYSAGNNIGIAHAIQQIGPNAQAFCWLLNNDTVVAPDALLALVQLAQETGGLAGSLLLYPDGCYQQVGTRLNWLTGGSKGYSEKKIQDKMPVDTLSGASMLIPFSAIQAVGLLDESFFLYFEDGEYSLRCAHKGFSLNVATQSRVYHKEGATTGRKSLSTQYYFYRNRMKLLFMYAHPLQKLSIGLYTLFRLGRSIIKLYWGSEKKHIASQLSIKIQVLALQDFWKGVSGPCPHNLENWQ
jgi:GT2 family glycosyltransferase